jgi:uncharacterized protein
MRTHGAAGQTLGDDVTIVYAFYDATERGDMDAILRLLDSDLSWGVPEPLPYGGTYRGHEGFRRYRGQIGEHFQPGYRFAKDATFPCDEQILVLGHLSGKAQGTDLPIETPFVHVWTVRDGVVKARHYHLDTSAMLRAFTAAEDGAGRVPGADEVVLEVYEATMAGDKERVLGLLSPEVEWRMPDSLPYGGRFTGPEGVQETRARSGRVFAGTPRFDREEMFHSAPDVVVTGTMRATVQGSGADVEVPFVHVWTVRDGKVAARRQYTDTASLGEALGPAS